MATPTLEKLRNEYNTLLQTCEIRTDKLAEVQHICDTILANKARYEAIATASGVPWFMVAAIHSLEGSLSFKTHLHNGDPLSARTVHVPAGRPKEGSPPFTFEESAIDALAFDNVARNLEPTFAGICFKLEGFNGFGYRRPNIDIHTPYLWSFSNQYTKGKFGSDNNFDPKLVSQQCGGAVILRRLLEMKAIEFEGVKQPELKDDPRFVFPLEPAADSSALASLLNDQELLLGREVRSVNGVTTNDPADQLNSVIIEFNLHAHQKPRLTVQIVPAGTTQADMDAADSPDAAQEVKNAFLNFIAPLLDSSELVCRSEVFLGGKKAEIVLLRAVTAVTPPAPPARDEGD